MLEVKDITYTINEKKIFKNLNMSFLNHKAYLVSGHSGSGKSKLCSILVGIIFPEKGDVLIDERSVLNINYPEILAMRQKFGVLFDVPALISNITINDNLHLNLDIHYPDMSEKEKDKLIVESLNYFELSYLKNERPSVLSRGESYLVSMARSLIINPSFFLWDDAYSNIEDRFYARIDFKLKELLENGSTVILFSNKYNLTPDYITDQYKLERIG